MSKHISTMVATAGVSLFAKFVRMLSRVLVFNPRINPIFASRKTGNQTGCRQPYQRRHDTPRDQGTSDRQKRNSRAPSNAHTRVPLLSPSIGRHGLGHENVLDPGLLIWTTDSP